MGVAEIGRREGRGLYGGFVDRRCCGWGMLGWHGAMGMEVPWVWQRGPD